MSTGTRDSIETIAKQYGLSLLGITDLDVSKRSVSFRKWLADGRHGSMKFLERYQDIRVEPSRLLPEGGESALVFGWWYDGPNGSKTSAALSEVAAYAMVRDYHKELSRRLKTICKKLTFQYPTDQFVVCVDTKPVLEKALAEKSSLGFIGKNTLYIHPSRGSYVLLGIIVCSVKFDKDVARPVDLNRKTVHGGCGPCSRCQVSCPTGALNEAYQIDATKCLAYWTIENRGPIPEEYWPYLGETYFGCDRCQAVCPYNHRAIGAEPNPRNESSLQKVFPDVYEIATMEQPQYEKYFGGTALTRAGIHGLKRNALIALWARKDRRLKQAIKKLENFPVYPIDVTLEQIQRLNGRDLKGLPVPDVEAHTPESLPAAIRVQSNSIVEPSLEVS